MNALRVFFLFTLVLLPVVSAAQTFDILDTDGNGILTVSELRAVANDLPRLHLAFNRLDIDDNGILSRSELGIDGRLLLSSADKDADGVLTFEELQLFLQNEDTGPMIKEMDINGDGNLDRHEYYKKRNEFKAGVWVPLMRF